MYDMPKEFRNFRKKDRLQKELHRLKTWSVNFPNLALSGSWFLLPRPMRPWKPSFRISIPATLSSMEVILPIMTIAGGLPSLNRRVSTMWLAEPEAGSGGGIVRSAGGVE